MPISDLVNRLIAQHGGNTEKAALQLGTSAASLSRWRSGKSRPRRQLEERMRTIVDGSGDLVSMIASSETDTRVERLEEAIAGTLHALREEFHRIAAVSTRQEVLDLVAALFFAHVTSIDNGGAGIGTYLQEECDSAVIALNRFMETALAKHLPVRNGFEKQGLGKLVSERLFAPLSVSDEPFALNLLRIFERDAAAFQELHEAGRDDLINEVFSRFMSTSFVDEKEMGQYLTPPEIARFMTEVGFHALTAEAKERLLDPSAKDDAGVILDPSCGVGSFLAEAVRFCHAEVRKQHTVDEAMQWLERFVSKKVIGIDKSERMIRLAMVNLGLFGSKGAHLHLSNGLARSGAEGELAVGFEERVDLILTNPPFGATFSGTDINGFAMGRERAKAESEVLFLERYIDWLAPGGVVVSVVPDSVLVNRAPFIALRSWLKARCDVEAVLSLPPVTFAAAGTSTKTSILVLRKHHGSGAGKATFFGAAREVGFDVVTRNGQRRRVRSARTDLLALFAEYCGERPAELGRWKILDDGADRWDAPFQVGLPDNIASVVEHPHTTLLKVSDVATLVDQRVDPRRNQAREFDYVEISDVDTRSGLVGHKRILATEAPSRARKLIRANDVLMSTVRPERGAVGLVPPELDGAVSSTGFAVLRCQEIHPLALVWLLKTELVRRQVIRNNIGIAYPAISEGTCLDLVLPVTQEDLGPLSIAAQSLADRQQKFEEARKAFALGICNLDRETTGRTAGLAEVPNIVDGVEPSAVTDAA